MKATKKATPKATPKAKAPMTNAERQAAYRVRKAAREAAALENIGTRKFTVSTVKAAELLHASAQNENPEYIYNYWLRIGINEGYIKASGV